MISRLLPIPDSHAAWQVLPRAEVGGGQPLPAWARALARPLPRTTAAMLELDYLHRAAGPLDPAVRGKVRYAAARANRCRYSQAVALDDLRVAGLGKIELDILRGDGSQLPLDERVLLKFTCRFSMAANTVTDHEIVSLIARHGIRPVVAMVLLLEYAAFHDRLLRSLALSPEDDRRLPPLPVCFIDGGPPASAPVVPAQSGGDGNGNGHATKTNGHARGNGTVPAVDHDPAQARFSLVPMQNGHNPQPLQPPRQTVPMWEDVLGFLPLHDPRSTALRIVWNLVCLGYQSHLARAWSACTRAFCDESSGNRAFEDTRLWMHARALDCFC